MSTAPAGNVPRFEDPADYARARARLAEAGFSGRGITQRLAVATVPTAGVLDHPLYRWRTRGGDPLDTLIRLFLLYSAVPAGAAREALRPMSLESWVAAGVLRREGDSDTVVGTVRMLPYGPLVIVTDRPPRTEAEIPPDFVMSIGAATLTLANATVRRPARRALDLGCGCGTLALLAAEHSDEVYALDRNRRAVAYAEFNARFNGIDKVRCLEGDLFQPVAGLQGGFDLVACNPPFVISPESRYLYRDSGMRGDEICRRVARQAPKYLAEGGLCQMLCNWAHVAGEDWKQHLASWFEGGRCDAWVLRYETRDVAAYAEAWVKGDMALFEEWMSYYAREGIEAVSLGLVNLRRRTSPRNWVRIDDAPAKPERPVGGDVLSGFAARDLLEAADDAALLGARLRTADDVKLGQVLEPRESEWRVVQSWLYRTGGMAPRGDADPVVANLVASCAGDRTLRERVGDLADALGRPASEITPPVLGVVRQLILQGFLVPADPTSP